MATPTVEYTGDGTNRNFAITFPYLRSSHVKVYVGGDVVPFTLLNATTVQTTTAPAEGTTVTVRRETPEAPLHTLQNNRMIQAAQFNEIVKQAIYFAQERPGLPGLTGPTGPEGPQLSLIHI